MGNYKKPKQGQKRGRPRGSRRRHDQLVKDVVAVLQQAGWYAIRVESKALPLLLPTGKRIYITMAPPGTPDVIAIGKNGRFVAIEVKTGGSGLSADQYETRKHIIACGGLYYIVRNIETAKGIVNGYSQAS